MIKGQGRWERGKGKKSWEKTDSQKQSSGEMAESLLEAEEGRLQNQLVTLGR